MPTEGAAQKAMEQSSPCSQALAVQIKPRAVTTREASLEGTKKHKLIPVGFCCSGEHKIHFIPGMIGPFLGVTLVPQPEVRNIMIPIFHDMMDWEQRKHGSFKQVRQHLQCPGRAPLERALAAQGGDPAGQATVPVGRSCSLAILNPGQGFSLTC